MRSREERRGISPRPICSLPSRWTTTGCASARCLVRPSRGSDGSHDAGWAGLSWPKEYGGQSLPEWTEEVFAGEHARFGVSTKVLSVGLQMVASVLRRHGTEAQRDRYLPPIVRAEEIWCQLFSEPDAGSDLASISSRALPTTDGWEITGQKVWTSGAGVCDQGLLLARTDRIFSRAIWPLLLHRPDEGDGGRSPAAARNVRLLSLQ